MKKPLFILVHFSGIWPLIMPSAAPWLYGAISPHWNMRLWDKNPENCDFFDNISPVIKSKFLSGLPTEPGKKAFFSDIDFIRAGKRMIRDILAEKPQLIGFSMYLDTVFLSTFLIALIREENPDIPIIIGGPYCKFQSFIVEMHHKYSCFVACGDGIIALQKTTFLLKDLWENKEGEKGFFKHIIANVPQLYPGFGKPYLWQLPLEDWPLPDYGIFQNKEYGPHIKVPIMHSRGCPNSCVFCTNSSFTPKYELFDSDFFIKGLESAYALFPHREYFSCDSLFFSSYKKMKEIKKKMVAKNIKVVMNITTVPVQNKKSIQIMKEMGVITITYGVESASLAQRRLMNKPYNRKLDACIRYTKEMGIDTAVNMIIGFPKENIVHILINLLFIFRNRKILSLINLNPFIPLEGAKIFEQAEKWGIKNVDEGHNWYSSYGTGKKARRLKLFFFEKFANILGIRAISGNMD